MIVVFGSTNVDLISHVRQIARPGETVLSEDYVQSFGGKGANQAVAAARICAGTGTTVMLASAVGTDTFGADCVGNLRSNGVNVSLVAINDRRTGCAFISVDDTGENAITVASGANGTVRASAISDTALIGMRFLVLQMEVSLEENVQMAARAKALGARVILNLAPAPSNVPAVSLRELLRQTDILVVNEHEAAAVAEMLSRDGLAPSDNAAIASFCDLCLIVTKGADGVSRYEADGAIHYCAAKPVTVVDTTGAGDTFVGALAAFLAADLPMEVAMNRACSAATFACLALGAQAGMPDIDKLERFG